jgi:AcrR family transcriptional regulator
MADTSQPQSRVGRPPRLSREAVLDAAEEIVELDGPEALTMRRVAEGLGSSPMALYRHVRDKDELLVLLLDRLARRLPRPELSADPRQRALQVLRVFHDGGAANPWVAGVLAAGDAMAPSVLPMIEEILAAFVACGMSPAQAGAAYRRCWQFTVGELMVVHGGRRHVQSLGRRPVQLSILDAVDGTVMPTLAQLVGYWEAARSQDTYAQDIAGIVDGLLAGR